MKINLLHNGEFTSRKITSESVGELRKELKISSDIYINVGGLRRTNDYPVQEGDYVSYYNEVK